MEAFAFAARCRCGKTKEACPHPQVPNDIRQILPPSVEPISYELALTCRIEDHAFDGVVSIKVAVVEPVTTVTLHAAELKVHSASCTGVGDATSIVLNEEATTLTLKFASTLRKGEAVLKIAFTGQHNNQMNGFYRSEYTDVHGNKKTMVSTQFESIDARKCLPCWDEPERKATFKCSLRVPVHMTALSNMPESRLMSHGDGTKTVSFLESPRMSTYLLAFVVGEFDHVSSLTQHGVLIRVFGPPGKPELGEFALDCAVKALDVYDDTFGQPFPLPKQDMVAIPEFAMGAMENWGLVTYREVDLLIDAAASSRQRQRVAEVVIHELAHQWFGNLVTMAWWDDLWLNEGFATWLETSITDNLYPEWKMWEQFIIDMQGRALKLDALRSSHPIQVPIGDAKEVEQVFDAISYCKGGSVIRMIHAVVGDAAFKEGLREYMATFKYGNATTNDLWAAWAKSSGQPIEELMGQWTKQMGFPLVEVVGMSAGKLDLKQSWFLSDGSAVAKADEKTWPIPIFAVTDAPGVPPPMAFLNDATGSVSVPGTCKWVKLNAGQNVPMRVKYPDAMIGELAAAVRAKAISPTDRIGLLADYQALCKAGLVDPVAFLELLAAYEEEDDANVFGGLLESVLGVGNAFKGGAPELAEAFGALGRALILPMHASLGWDPRDEDGHLTRKLRGEVLSALPSLCGSDPSVLGEARGRYAKYLADPSPSKAEGKKAVPPEIAGTIFKLIGTNGGAKEFDELLKLYETLELNDDKKAVFSGLGAAPTAELRTRALDYASSGAIKLQDFFYVALVMHRSSAEGMEATWEYFKAHKDKYVSMLATASASLMDAVISGACSSFATKEKAAEVEAFFGEHAKTFEKNERTIKQTLEAVKANAAFVERFKASNALEWLRSKYK